jgi:hypothetical protein
LLGKMLGPEATIAKAVTERKAKRRKTRKKHRFLCGSGGKPAKNGPVEAMGCWREEGLARGRRAAPGTKLRRINAMTEAAARKNLPAAGR